MKEKIKKYPMLLGVLIFAIIFAGAIAVKAATGDVKQTSTDSNNPSVKLTTDVKEYKMVNGSVGELTFKVAPEKAVVSKEVKPKHVVLVLNSSITVTDDMLKAQKNVAKKIIDSFSKDVKTTFSIIDYNVLSNCYYSHETSGEGLVMKDDAAKKYIDEDVVLHKDLKLGNNIGDAIRCARTIFNNELNVEVKGKNLNKDDYDKYMIFIASGSPSAFTNNKIDPLNNQNELMGPSRINESNFHRDQIKYKGPKATDEDKYYYTCYRWRDTNNERINPTEKWAYMTDTDRYKVSTVNPSMDTAQYDGIHDPKGFSAEYANNMAEQFGESENVKSFFIEYLDETNEKYSNENFLKDIVGKAKGEFFHVTNPDELQKTYDMITEDIKSKYYYGNPKLHIKLPENMLFYNDKSNWTSDGVISLPNFEFTVDKVNGSTKELKGKEFEVKVKFKTIKPTTQDNPYVVNPKPSTKVNERDINITYTGLEEKQKVQTANLDDCINVYSTEFNPKFEVKDAKGFDSSLLKVDTDYNFKYTVKGENRKYAEVEPFVKQKKVVLAIDESSVIKDDLKAKIKNMVADERTSIAIVKYKDFANIVPMGKDNFSKSSTEIENAITKTFTEKNDKTGKDNAKVSNIGNAINVAASLLKDGDETKNIVIIGNLNSEDTLEYSQKVATSLNARSDLNLYGLGLTNSYNDLEGIIKAGSGEMITADELNKRVTADLCLIGDLKQPDEKSNSNIIIEEKDKNKKFALETKVTYHKQGDDFVSDGTIKCLNLKFAKSGNYTLHKHVEKDGQVSDEGNNFNIAFALKGNEKLYYAADPITVDVIEECNVKVGLYSNKKNLQDEYNFKDFLITGNRVSLANNNYFQGATIIEISDGQKCKFELSYKLQPTQHLDDFTVELYKVGQNGRGPKIDLKKTEDNGLVKFEMPNDKNLGGEKEAQMSRYLVTYKARIKVDGKDEEKEKEKDKNENKKPPIVITSKLNSASPKIDSLTIDVVKAPDLF